MAATLPPRTPRLTVAQRRPPADGRTKKKHLVSCPACGMTRALSYKAAWLITQGINTGLCRSCGNGARKRAAAIESSGEKRCIDCGQFKPLSEFGTKAHGVGRHSYCGPCDRKRGREWYRRNRERAMANVTAWVAANRDRRRAIARDFYARMRATGRIEPVDWAGVLKRERGTCHICGEAIGEADLTFDHVVPLSRGGAHSTDNIKLAHRSCNGRKGVRLVEELA